MTLRTLPLHHPGTPDLRSPGLFLLWLARAQWRIQALGVGYGVVWMVSQAAVPAVIGVSVQGAVRDEPRTVGWGVAAILALGVVQGASALMRHRVAVETWIIAASRTQQLVARRASDLGADLPRQVATGEVVAVTASDVEKIGSAFDVLSRFSGAVVAFLAVAVALLVTSPLLGAVVLGGVPLFAVAVGPLLKPLERRESAQRVKLGRATELASDTVAGLRVLRGIGGEELFLDRFRAASQEVRAAAFATARVRSLLDALQVALPGAFVVTVTWLGARLALEGRISVGQLIAFYGWTAFLVVPLRTLTEAAHKWTRARVAAARIVRVLAIERAEAIGGATLADADLGGATPVLADPATGVVVERGLFTAVVCGDPEVAGRLADRFGGYVDVASGLPPALLDGVATRDVPLDRMRAEVLVQDKDPVLLSGTVAELLDVPGSGRVTPAEAVAAASANDVLQALLESHADVGDPLAGRLTERGRTLSGGQRQRLALARSLVADPPVLVLDEPTSAVDAHTEVRLARSLREARAGRTTVVLTSSPLLLEHADTVVLVEPAAEPAAEWRSSLTGTHRELMRDHRYRAVVARGEGS